MTMMPSMSSSSTPKILISLYLFQKMFMCHFCVIEVVEGILYPVIEGILYIDVYKLPPVSATQKQRSHGISHWREFLFGYHRSRLLRAVANLVLYF